MPPEPVERFFAHALGPGASRGATRIAMRGRIRVGVWLPFVAEQTTDARGFVWRARVARGLLQVTDRYGDGRGRTEGRLGGRVMLFADDGEDVARSAAGRAALEAVAFAPGSVAPGTGAAEWRAEADDVIVARFDLPPERPEVRVRIDADGAVRELSAERWGKPDGSYGYATCGCVVHGERQVGGLTLPAAFEVGWHFGTARYAPFFRAEIVGRSNAADDGLVGVSPTA